MCMWLKIIDAVVWEEFNGNQRITYNALLSELRSTYGYSYNKSAPFFCNFFQRPKRTIDFIFQNYSFHPMTINFPVLSPVCYIFYFNVVAFCSKYKKKIDAFPQISVYFC